MYMSSELPENVNQGSTIESIWATPNFDPIEFSIHITQNRIFGVTFCLELHVPIYFYY